MRALCLLWFLPLTLGELPSCPKKKTVGDACYERCEDDVDTSQHGCTANCTYKKVGDFGDHERFCFQRPGYLPVTNDCTVTDKYPQIVEHGEILGECCNRDCTTDNEKNNTCAFTFYIENLQSDQNGRRADGRIRNVTTYNGVLPGPGIVVCEGDTVVLRLFNHIKGTFEELYGHSNGTTLHMHGIRRYNESFEDGVPGVNQCEVKSGGNFTYTMKAKIENHENAPNGTYWYHSHVGSQRTDGAEGKLIIMPRKKSSLYDIDNADNTLFLQEWYGAPNNSTPISILINGKGRVGKTMNSVPKNINWDEHIHKYKLGYQVEFEQVPNPDYNSDYYPTNYSEFDVQKDLRYRFRIIGAIGQNFPLLVSIEDHNFTAIATDAVEFNPVENIQGVWLAAGERYDIVIHTKKNPRQRDPYKIKVYGNTAKHSPLCTIAWLKYPGQEINNSYIPDSKCIGFNATDLQKILNPVLSTYINKNDTKYVFLNDLRSKNHQLNNMNQTFDTYYVEFINLSFNNLSMTYDAIPFLYQSPAKPTCGPNCTITYDGPNSIVTCDNTIRILDHCTKGDRCQCPHVNHQPHVPGPKGPVRWFETILINPHNEDMPISHPIHQHGGWFALMAEHQFPPNMTINRTKIIEMDKNCTRRKLCLPRNRSYPIQKDTIQVPQNGYVIVRTRVDNAGTWIFHCHINHHVESGMAMVLQIGELGDNQPSQHWNLGPYKDKINEPCLRKLNTYQNPAAIKWFYGMKPITACVRPGHHLTFVWNYGHNVNNITKKTWEECRPGGPNITFKDTTPFYGDYTKHFPENIPENTTLYFACGLGPGGYHCKYGGLKAKVTVTKNMTACMENN